MARLLIHVTTGPENPTRAALGLLVAKTALGGGHEVDVFLAADAVDYLRAETREAAHGIGTGSAAEHWAALVEGGARLFASGLSSKARGITPEAGVELAPPDRLVALILEADRVVVY
jgi:uncharacterized protein